MAHATLDPSAAPSTATPLCIVGIRASRAGLKACCELFQRLPSKTGMAFVLVMPLDPGDPTPVCEHIAGATTMPVHTAYHRMPVAADHVYVVPSHSAMVLVEGRFDLGPPLPSRMSMPADAFFRSLAVDQRDRAIGVVLSGGGADGGADEGADGGADGALGLQAIKAEGGICIAEAPSAEGRETMPLCAIAAGCVDLIKPIAEIAAEITALGERFGATLGGEQSDGALDWKEDLAKIFSLLHAAHRVDFTLYRPSMIKRRIARRMVLHQLASVTEYVDYLKATPPELETLYQDILIKVTHFFRDPGLFSALKAEIFPRLVRAQVGDEPIRIWVPGCSTGEEVYSIAISLREVLGDERRGIPIQIFATDVSEAALDHARAGVYLENIAVDVSPQRLRRFFSRVGPHYQISREIRAMCVFASQNMAQDPPFSRLDLISCRNVLIYLEPILQKRVLQTFHYALKSPGFLLLGTSETAGSSELFAIVDKKNKVYEKSSSTVRTALEFLAEYGVDREKTERTMQKLKEGGDGRGDVLKAADKLVMGKYAPAGVIINAALEIVQFRGHTGPFLEPAPGEASLHILKMAREGLLLELRTAIYKAKRTGASVRTEPLRVQEGDHVHEVCIDVIPLRQGDAAEPSTDADTHYLILFEEPSSARRAPSRRAEEGKKLKRAAESFHSDKITALEREIQSMKEHLQAIIEEHEVTNEELQTSNEELLSSNEELQSINEELETAKEELQSTNEELTTVNEELEHRNTDLSVLTDDLSNLLAGADIPIVMVSRELRIRRYTQQAGQLFNVGSSDLGRPIGDAKLKIDVPELERMLSEAIDSASIQELAVQDKKGSWYLMRIRPYRTAENQIDGAVICFVDIDALKRHLDKAAPPQSSQKTVGSHH